MHRFPFLSRRWLLVATVTLAAVLAAALIAEREAGRPAIAAPDCVNGPAGLAAYYFDGSQGTLNLSDGRTWVITLTDINGSGVTGNGVYHLLIQDHGTGSGWETLPTQTHHDFSGAGGHLLQSDDNGWVVRSSHGFNPGDVPGNYDLRVVMSQRGDGKWDISPYYRLPAGDWTLFYDGAWTTASAFDLTKTRVAVGIDAGGDGTLCFSAPTANAVDLSNVFVDDDWVGLPDSEEVYFPGDPDPHYIGLDAFAAIQDGIDNVYGSTVSVAPGTYDETVTFGSAFAKDGLVVSGDAGDRPVITGGVRFSNTSQVDGLTLENLYLKGNAGNGVVDMDNAGVVNDLTVDNCVIDGELDPGLDGGFLGQNLGQSFTMTDNEFKDILGWALMDINSGSGDGGNNLPLTTVTFTGNDIRDSNGSVALRGNAATKTAVVNASGNTWDNIGGNGGETGQQWAALEVNHAQQANVTGNSINDVQLGEWGEGQALQLWDVDTVDVSDNDITNNAQGIFIYGGTFGGGPWPVPGGIISNNRISGNAEYGISVDADATGGPLNAEKNWWGDATGADHSNNPHGTGQGGDTATDNVDFTPWYATSTTTPGTENVSVTHNSVIIAVSDTIQGAIAAALNGDTVAVGAGKYTENVIVNKDVTLAGANPPDGGSAAVVNGTIDITAGGATVQSLKVVPGSVNGNERAIAVYAANATVTGNLIDGMTGDGTGSIIGIGIYGDGPTALSDIAIADNVIKNIDNPAAGGGGYGGADGVMVQGVVDGVDVTGNTIEDIHSAGWAYGIEVTPSAGAPASPPQDVLVHQNSISVVNDGSVYDVFADLYAAPYIGIGLSLDETSPGADDGDASQVTISDNSFANTVPLAVLNKDTDQVLDASGNWWGSNDPSTVATRVLGIVDYSPWLDAGTDTSGDPGFQGDFSVLHVDDDSPQSGSDGHIQEGINLVSGSTVLVEPGTYTEQVTIDKSLTLTGDTSGSCPGPGTNAPVLDGGGAVGSAITIAGGAANVTIQGFEITNYRNRTFGSEWTTGGIGSGVLAWSSSAIDNVTVRDNYLHDLGWSAVLAGNEGQTLHDNWLVECNSVADVAAYAIELTNAANSSIVDNEVTGGEDILGEATDDSEDAILIQTQIHTGSGQTNAGITVEGNTVSGPLTRAGIELLTWDSTDSLTAMLDDVTVSSNTVTGAITRGVFAYTVGTNATVDNLSIDGNVLDGSVHGIQISDVVGTHGSIDITGNDILNSTGTSSGVRITAGTSATGIGVNYNNIVGNALLGVSHEGTGTLDAEHNWWGACDGPSGEGPGSGDAVSTNVDYDPWDLGVCDKDGDGLTNDEETYIYGTDPLNPDTDGDVCYDGAEVLPVEMVMFGGGRDPLYPWDYFNPTNDGKNRVDDILAIVEHYFLSEGDPGYDVKYDRTYVGPEDWNLGPPDGKVRVDDILNMVNHYFHDCGEGIEKPES